MLNLSEANQLYANSLEDTMTLLTVEDAANILMVGKNRIYELLNQGKIKGMRIGKSTWRIPKISIYQYIQTQSALYVQHVKRTALLWQSSPLLKKSIPG